MLESKYKINHSVINLRKSKTSLLGSIRDFEQETQLLLNESIQLISIEGEWAHIELKEQKKYVEDGFKGYRGWIEKKYLVKEFICDDLANYIVCSKNAVLKTTSGEIFLSFGTHLPLIKKENNKGFFLLPDQSMGHASLSHFKPFNEISNRNEIVKFAHLFIDDPYLWGGRSSYNSHDLRTPSSIDCSGLISLLFKLNNLYLPRNAVDLYQYTHKITGKELLPGDLIFSSSRNNFKIDHVMLYTGSNEIIEATMIVNKVRKIDCLTRFGVNIEQINKESIETEEIKLYFGKLFL